MYVATQCHRFMLLLILLIVLIYYKHTTKHLSEHLSILKFSDVRIMTITGAS